MKKLKLILPMLAFVFAIALSFAFTNATADDYYATGFIQIGTTWYEVDVDCNEVNNNDCKVRLEGQSQVYTVYADESTNNPLRNSSNQIKVIPDPRP